MLFAKTYNSLVFSTILLSALTASIPCRAFFDDFDLDALLNDESTEAFIRDSAIADPNLCDPTSIVPVLIDLGIVPILEENFYLHTSELNNRSLLDFPIFLPRRWPQEPITIGFDFFWNKTNRMFFTGSSSAISSYINIGPSTLLEALTTSFEKIAQLAPLGNTPFQPARIFPLLRNFTVEERRTGVMFHAEKRLQKLFFYCFVPIYYIERNMFASEIEQEALTLVFGRLDQKSENEFAKRHLISDKFGLGDTRLSMDFQIRDSDLLAFNLGFFTTLPTAFAFAKAMQGSTFHTATCPPQISIIDTICPFLAGGTIEEKDAVFANLTNFAFKALDNLSAQVLETPLGNGGHFGLGFALQTDSHLRNFIKRPWARAIDFRSRISLEYLFPAKKTRSFLLCDRTPAFDALGLNASDAVISAKAENNEAYASAVIAFFNEQISQEFFPPTFNARVYPGFIFRSTSKTFHDSDRWHFALGNDFWLQSNEKLNHLEIPQECKNDYTINETIFNIKAAEKPVAYQGKVWGTVAYKIERDDKEWILSLNVDETYLNSGIGSDYTVALGFEAHF